ncbi:MAG: DUF4340 domain-containing protein [Oscillospiraceae bacterium]
MKKRTKGIIAGSCAVVLLAGALVALKLTEPETEEEDNLASTSDASAKTSALLYDKNPSDVSSVEVTNADGGYTVERYADNFWTIPDISGLPLDYTSVNSAVETLATLTAQQVVSEAPEDLSVYGLDEPQLKAKVVFDSGNISEKTIIVGDETPKGGEYYFKLEDSDTVYTIKSSDISLLFAKEYDFINHVLYDNVMDDDTEDDYDPRKINSMTVSRPDLEYDIVVEYDVRQDYEEIITGNSSSYVMTAPVSLDLNPDKSDDMMELIFGITASDVAAVEPDEAALNEYGLTEPACTVTYDINAGAATLYIGNKCYNDSGVPTGYYVMREGLDVVYILDTANVPWVSIQPLDITMTMITSTYIYSVESIEIAYDGRTETFEPNGDKDDFVVKHNGEDADADLFKSLYQYILRAPAEEIYLGDIPDKEPDVSITIKNEYGEDKLDFYSDADRKSIIVLNGKANFKCRTAYVDRLIDNLGHYAAGEDIVTSW